MNADAPCTVGPYRLEELLGKGGMGEVYRAYDQRLDRRVAIKHVRPEAAGNPTSRARFRREAWMAARLSHPALVQIFDILEEEDGDWIVMELIDGPSIAEMMRDGPLELDDVLAHGRQVAEGLAEAHDKGIVHRDLKAENVMLSLVATLRASRWRPQAAATRLGIPRSSIYDLIAKSDRVRKASDLGREEIEASRERCGGSVARMADALEVSERALRRRIGQLGLQP